MTSRYKPFFDVTHLPDASLCRGKIVEMRTNNFLYTDPYQVQSINGQWVPITKCFLGAYASFPTSGLVTGAIATASDFDYQDFYWTGTAWKVCGQHGLASFVQTISFGLILVDSCSVVITAPSSIYVGNQVLAWISPELSGTPSLPSSLPDELQFISFTCGCTPVASGTNQSTCHIRASSKTKGSYQLRYAFVNP
jgi:hypothetical protein